MRSTLAAAILCIAALWPLVHRGLVARYDINPWKLFGFAMYAAATPPVQVVVFQRGPADLEPIDAALLPQSLQQRLNRFRIERHALGSLRRPDDIGPLILEALPEQEWIVIAVQRMILDRETATMRSHRSQYLYERSESAQLR